jgi:hypothetical protein
MKVYLAGQFSRYSNWKEEFRNIKGFDFYDPEIDSNQSCAETFFPQDLQAVSQADILIANPGITPSEGTWIEVGYFLALNTKQPGEKCKSLIIIWDKERVDWSIEFVKKTGYVVNTVKGAILKLEEISLQNSKNSD